MMSDCTQLSELRDLIARFAGREGDQQTAIESLYLVRYSSCLSPDFSVVTLGLCVVAQGQKELLLQGEVYASCPGQYVVASAEIPVSARVLRATPTQPHLGLRFNFDVTSLRSLIEDAGLPPPPDGVSRRGLYSSPTRPALLDAVLRLVRLLQSPAEIPVLAPLIEREILFRLLLDENSAALHHMAQANSSPHRIGVAIRMAEKAFSGTISHRGPGA